MLKNEKNKINFKQLKTQSLGFYKTNFAEKIKKFEKNIN